MRDQGILTPHQVKITLGGQPEHALTEGVRPSTFLFMDARSDRDAWNSDRLWAVEQMSGQHWPIELCIAWVAERSKEEAVAAWLSFRFGRGPSDAWASAQHTLVSDFVQRTWQPKPPIPKANGRR
ncbi:MAG: hypothetical protein J0J10_25480 [Bosea sp.]|uniref:hypothetical protein n=1 Tax=Bosea sp. (in: a-proteobacteria) TaxID=1871050 RepID=UPI001ACEDB3F|nr:hypothetical protein [Bosea sp. (in: a-proteobacteria)]MBN9472121.1 hypothetical protein [Bosea sp. (in: a-proteobacteria)]